MPYAQWHYPFENKEIFEKGFPADFIAEGIDQCRGWFYTLLVLSTALFDKPAFKNLIVNGLVLAADGKKMSKRLKNYPPVDEVINEFGADSLRLYLITSPVVRADKLKFQKPDVGKVINDVFLRWINAYRLLVQNTHLMAAAGHAYSFDPDFGSKVTNVFDKWILAYTQSLIAFVRKEMDAYRLYTVCPKLVTFISDLANWYCRLNRRRLKGSDGLQEQQLSLDTLYHVLYTLCPTMAPFTPFFVEYLYQNLRLLQPKDQQLDSVHYLPFPTPDKKLFNEEIERRVTRTQEVITLGRQARDRGKIPIKQPLGHLTVFQKDKQYVDDILMLEAYIKEEVNVRSIVIKNEDFGDSIQLKPIPNRNTLGKRLKGDRAKVEAAINALPREQLLQFEAKKSMVILGHTITDEDLTLSNEFTGATANEKAAWTDNVLIVLNVQITDDLKSEGIMREICNRIQKLRKTSGLKSTDQGIIVHYKLTGKAAKEQEAILKSLKDYQADIQKKTGTRLESGAPPATNIGSTSVKINGIDVSFTMCRE